MVRTRSCQQRKNTGVSVIDTTTQAVVSTVLLPTGATPFGMAITPDGTHAYVTDDNPFRIFVIDTSLALTNLFKAVAPPIDLSSSSVIPREVAISPDSASAYVTSTNDSRLAVIDRSNN